MIESTCYLTPTGPRRCATERRGHVRHGDRNISAPAVRYLVRPSFRYCWALLEDVSATGVGLLLGHAAAPGTVLLLQLGAYRPGHADYRLARVVHARARADGYWVVGCGFTRPLTADELAAVRWDLDTDG
jgi:PilZ domain-containing protein